MTDKEILKEILEWNNPKSNKYGGQTGLNCPPENLRLEKDCTVACYDCIKHAIKLLKKQ